MACGPVETNRVEQFHIDGSRVNAEQVRRHRHIYLLHSDVSESTIDCDMFALAVATYIARAVCLNNTGTTSAPTTYEPDLVPTSDDHVPAFPSSPGEFTEPTTRDAATRNATARWRKFFWSDERRRMNASVDACWLALGRMDAACNVCCRAFAQDYRRY